MGIPNFMSMLLEMNTSCYAHLNQITRHMNHSDGDDENENGDDENENVDEESQKPNTWCKELSKICNLMVDTNILIHRHVHAYIQWNLTSYLKSPQFDNSGHEQKSLKTIVRDVKNCSDITTEYDENFGNCIDSESDIKSSPISNTNTNTNTNRVYIIFPLINYRLSLNVNFIAERISKEIASLATFINDCKRINGLYNTMGILRLCTDGASPTAKKDTQSTRSTNSTTLSSIICGLLRPNSPFLEILEKVLFNNVGNKIENLGLQFDCLQMDGSKNPGEGEHKCIYGTVPEIIPGGNTLRMHNVPTCVYSSDTDSIFISCIIDQDKSPRFIISQLPWTTTKQKGYTTTTSMLDKFVIWNIDKLREFWNYKRCWFILLSAGCDYLPGFTKSPLHAKKMVSFVNQLEESQEIYLNLYLQYDYRNVNTCPRKNFCCFILQVYKLLADNKFISRPKKRIAISDGISDDSCIDLWNLWCHDVSWVINYLSALYPPPPQIPSTSNHPYYRPMNFTTDLVSQSEKCKRSKLFFRCLDNHKCWKLISENFNFYQSIICKNVCKMPNINE
jgi:hypothetical protein